MTGRAATSLLVAAVMTVSHSTPSPAQDASAPYVRLAELVVDAAQLGAFKAAIQESVAAAVRVEPGVLALYAVAEKDRPTHIRVVEIYTDPEAYRLHLETPHFRKFRDTTDPMVTSRKLLDAVPIALAAKPS